MDVSCCRFRATVKVSWVRIRVMVIVRIGVRVGMPIPECRYGKNARTAANKKNRYQLPVLYTQPKGKTRLAPLFWAEPSLVVF